MDSAIQRPPRTIMEVFKNLPEGTLAELIDNVIYMSPSPTHRHQQILNEINFQLLTHFKSMGDGQVFIAPLDVYLDENMNAVQPDIIVMLSENADAIHSSGHIHGVPDLIVEILSPGNRDFDLVKKKDLYEKFRVKEYWVVDPESRLAIGYFLEAFTYSKISEAVGELVFKSVNLKISI